MDAHRIEPCWRQVAPALAEEILALWRDGDAIGNDGEAARRTAEAVCVARAGGGRLVAVATAQPREIPFLAGETMYYLRAFIAPHARGGLLGHRLLGACQRLLADDAAGAQPASAAIGIFLELESPVFRREDEAAVWRRSGMVYAGRTPRGLQRRIWYFPGARLRRGG